MSSLRRILASVTARYFRTQSWRKIRTAWSETGSTLKKAWIVLWAVGLVLLTFGVWGDSAGFWTSKPFLTNTFSALTGAAFGIPLALVVLQRVAASEADSAEARAAHRMAATVSANIALAAGALVEGGVAKLREAKVYLENQRDAIPSIDSYFRHPGLRDLRIEPQLYVDTIDRISTYVDQLFSPKVMQLLAEVSAQWSILNTESRSRLLETGGKWLTGLEVRELNRLVMGLTGPTLETWLQQESRLMNRFRFVSPHVSDYDKTRSIIDVVRPFETWLEEILAFVDDTAELITASAAAAQTLALL
jgi:hypothetical protein